MKRISIIAIIAMMAVVACTNAQQKAGGTKNPYYSHTDGKVINVSDAEWKKILPADVYYIMREKGTERAGTGKYAHTETKGTYYCASCGHPLFSAATKYDSYTGWPSFYQALQGGVKEQKDADGDRDEVVCERCGGHLGHVFDDGPAPTHLRYCMNSPALQLENK